MIDAWTSRTERWDVVIAALNHALPPSWSIGVTDSTLAVYAGNFDRGWDLFCTRTPAGTVKMTATGGFPKHPLADGGVEYVPGTDEAVVEYILKWAADRV